MTELSASYWPFGLRKFAIRVGECRRVGNFRSLCTRKDRKLSTGVPGAGLRPLPPTGRPAASSGKKAAAGGLDLSKGHITDEA